MTCGLRTHVGMALQVRGVKHCSVSLEQKVAPFAGHHTALAEERKQGPR